MALQAFSSPFPEARPWARLLRAGGTIYKFNIRGGSSFRHGEEVIRGSKEMEDIIRTVLGNLDNLQPFSSAHYNIFPYKRRWEGLAKLMCGEKKRGKKLTAYPFVLVLYLEKSMQSGAAAAMTHTIHQNTGKQAEEELSLERDREQLSCGYEPQPKRCKTDSPLEEAILKDLIKELEAEGGKVSTVGLHVDNPHAEGEVQDPGHKNKKGTEVTPGTSQEEGEGEEEGEEGEHVDPRKPAGVLSRLARSVGFHHGH